MGKSKSSKIWGKLTGRRSHRAKTVKTVDVMTQVKCAIRNPAAAVFGGVLGGVVPWFARELAHSELGRAWGNNRPLAGLEIVVIAGCCLFSMFTVYKFGCAAFGDARKAAWYVAALEGVMLVSHGRTSEIALAMLIAINAIANGCVIALARDATLRRQEADARRQATRQATRDRQRNARTSSQRGERQVAAREDERVSSDNRSSAPAAPHALVVWTSRQHADVHNGVMDAEFVESNLLS
jgi:hypothetical protein